MTTELALEVTLPQAKGSMVGYCRAGCLVWRLKGNDHPQRDMQLEQKQGETHHRPHLLGESTGVKFTSHWLPGHLLPIRQPGNKGHRSCWRPGEPGFSGRARVVDLRPLPFLSPQCLYACLLIPIQYPLKSECKDTGKKLETLGRSCYLKRLFEVLHQTELI